MNNYWISKSALGTGNSGTSIGSNYYNFDRMGQWTRLETAPILNGFYVSARLLVRRFI